ncbi:hypothetical protein JHK85_050832 [Glycine max]|nr:hypothetical protein JHK85_050832 [Glycine max]
MSISTCNSHIRQGFHARHWIILVHTWGLDKLVTHCLTRILPHTSDRLPQRGTIYFDTGQPLLLASQLRAWGAYVLSRNHKIYVASYLALGDMCPPSCQRYLFKMTCEVRDPTQPHHPDMSRFQILTPLAPTPSILNLYKLNSVFSKPLQALLILLKNLSKLLNNSFFGSSTFEFPESMSGKLQHANNINTELGTKDLTSDDRLQNLFWSNGASQVDYQCFGDVVAFDTTYKNKYNKPLVIFCGYNHHEEIAIFDFVFIVDETIDTYKWVLERFSEAMFNKHPKCGDKW